MAGVLALGMPDFMSEGLNARENSVVAMIVKNLYPVHFAYAV